MNQRPFRYRTIDRASIARDVLRQWWTIILFSMAVALLINVEESFRYRPEYASSATFVVTTRGTNTSIYQDISEASDTAARFREVLESNVFRRTIAKELKVKNYDAITNIELLEETNLIELTVKHRSAMMAYQYICSIMNNYSTVTNYVVKNVVLEVIQRPKISDEPSNPNKALQTSLLGLFAAFFLGVAYVAYYSYLKDTVKNSREASTKLAARLLGTIYHENVPGARKSIKKTSMTILNPILSFKYTESCRMTASRVESRMDRKKAKTILITSVAENEGKSTVASNIALAMAQEGKRVLLIDADFRKPSLYKIFELDREDVADFVGILRSGKGFEKAVIRLKRYPLYMILNRTSTGSIEDVLANNQFSSLLKFARTHFDYIIIDTAPMGMVPDAEGIASICDASLMVVREDTILARNINDAIDTLNATNAKLIGVILNDARSGGRETVRNSTGYVNGRKV